MFTKPDLKAKIDLIWLIDSPGLQKTLLPTTEYKTTKQKCIRLLPEESIVGMMLYSDIEPLIISSNARGILQHDVTTWEIQEPAILKTGTGLSLKSICFEKTFQQWMAELKSQERKLFFDLLFDSFLSSGVSSLDDFNLASRAKMMKAFHSFRELDDDKKRLFNKSLKLLVTIFGGAYHDNSRETK